MKHSRKYSLIIICLLFLQLIIPFTQVVAVEIEPEPPTRFWHSIDNGNDLKLFWNVDSNMDEYRLYQIEDGKRKLLQAKMASQIKMTNLPEGQYHFEVTSYSEDFGESIPVTLSIDLQHPVIHAPNVLIAEVINGNDIQLTWKSVDFAQTYEVYEVTSEGKQFIETVHTTRYVAENMPEGTYAYEIYATSERFGKSLQSSGVEITVTHPTMEPPGTGYVRVDNLNDLVVWWKADDLASEYYLYQVVDGEEVFIQKSEKNVYKAKIEEGGDLVFKVRTYSDRFGLSPQTLTLTLESVELVLNSPTLNLQWFNGQKARLSWSRIPYSDSYNLYKVVDGVEELFLTSKSNTITLDDLPVGPHEFVVRAVNDTIGESTSSNAVSFEVRYDIQAPKTETNTTASWTNKDVAVELTATDDKSGVYKTYYTLGNDENAVTYEGNTFSFIEEGIHHYSFYSVDHSGNIEKITNEMVRIDKTAPVTTTNGENGSQHDTFMLRMDATDNLSGVYSTFYSINGEPFRSGNIAVLTKKGDYIVSYYTRDRAGNNEPVQTVQLTINGVEKDEEEVPLLGNLGLDKEEAENLFEHIGNDPEKMEELSNLQKTNPLPNWDPAKKNELLPQIEEFLNKLEEITETETITSMDEKPVSFDELMDEDKLSSNIVITINDSHGEMLADIVLPADKNQKEALTERESYKDPTETSLATTEMDHDRAREDETPTNINMQENDRVFKTVDGARLPDTASNMLRNILVGVILMLNGFLLFIKMKKTSPSSQS